MPHPLTCRGLVVVYGLLTCLAGCHFSDQPAAQPTPDFTVQAGVITVPDGSSLRTHLVVADVTAQAAGSTLDLPAAIEADPSRVVNILSPLTGRVVALSANLGLPVRKGAVLALIASGDLAQAYADVQKADDLAALAAKTLVRATGVLAAGGAATKDLESAQSSLVQARAEQQRARARLQALTTTSGTSAQDLVLAAPQDGVITALLIANGAQISDPTATLMTITNIDRVFVTADVPEAKVGMVTVGLPAEIDLTAYAGEVLHGTVSQVNDLLEPDSRRQKIRIAMANADHHLLPNLFATVKLPVDQPGTVSVPQSALMMNNDSLSVLCELSPWVFQRRAVVTGDENGDTVTVVTGLKAGDRVVVKGGVLLNE